MRPNGGRRTVWPNRPGFGTRHWPVPSPALGGILEPSLVPILPNIATIVSASSLPRNHYRVGLHIVLFEDCSAFTHVAACTLARSPNRDRYPKASDTSSPPCLLRSLPAGAVAGRGLHPLETRRLVTAHVEFGHSAVNAGAVKLGLATTARESS